MFESFILNGFITMASKDSGDSLQKTTFLGVLEKRSGQFIPEHADGKIIDVVKTAEVSPGILVRHPSPITPFEWQANPDTTSRDQISSYIIWCGYERQLDALKRQAWEQIKRFGFYQNKFPIWPSPEELASPKPWWLVDFALPEHWVQYIRSYNMIKQLGVLYPIAYAIATVTDLFMLANCLIIMTRGYIDADYSDDDNAVLSMIQAKDSIDTITAKVSRFIYRYRPVAGYTDESKKVTLRSLGKDIPGSAILWKHRKTQNAPPLGEFLVKTGILNEF